MSGSREHRRKSNRREESSFERDPNVLLTARNELTEEMKDIITPEVYRGLHSMWIDSKRTADNLRAKAKSRREKTHSASYLFQKNLALVKDWNSQVISDEFNMLLQKNNMTEEDFTNLLKSLFVINARIYSVINMNKNARPTLTIPNPRNFVHKIYITSARTFIENPYLFEDRIEKLNPVVIQKNMLVSRDIIRKAISDTIRKMTPVNEMLREYMKVTPDEDSEGSRSESDREDEPEDIAEKQLDRLERLSVMASGKESVRRSERLGELINEELDAMEQEKQEELKSSGLMDHLDEIASARSGKASIQANPEIPEQVFDNLIEGKDPETIGIPENSGMPSTHLRVAAHRTITESEAGQLSDEESPEEQTREINIVADDLQRQPIETIVRPTLKEEDDDDDDELEETEVMEIQKRPQPPADLRSHRSRRTERSVRHRNTEFFSDDEN